MEQQLAPSQVCSIFLARSRLSKGSLAQRFASSSRNRELPFYFSQHQAPQNIQVLPALSFKTLLLCLSSPFITPIHFSRKTPCQQESLARISYNYYYAFITLLTCFSKGVFYKSCRFSNQLPLNAITQAFFSVGNYSNTCYNEQNETVQGFPRGLKCLEVTNCPLAIRTDPALTAKTGERLSNANCIPSVGPNRAKIQQDCEARRCGILKIKLG